VYKVVNSRGMSVFVHIHKSSHLPIIFIYMTRGNQREIDRQRAAARHAGKGEAKDGDFLLRKVVKFN
jgi:hypothetical protein